MTTRYHRVLPRDLFNEADLLKCMGLLYLEAEKQTEVAVVVRHIGDPKEPFRILQSQSDGSLWLANVEVLVMGRRVLVSRPLNSRYKFSLYAQYRDRIESVFDDDGKLSREFLNLTEEEDNNEHVYYRC